MHVNSIEDGIELKAKKKLYIDIVQSINIKTYPTKAR
jgi:hypothetical protein